MPKPKPKADDFEALGPAGRRLYDAILAGYDLDEASRLVALKAAQTADLAEACRLDLVANGPTLKTTRGTIENPAAKTYRGALATIASLCRLLGVAQAPEV